MDDRAAARACFLISIEPSPCQTTVGRCSKLPDEILQDRLARCVLCHRPRSLDFARSRRFRSTFEVEIADQR
jgi:hypothetical protein